MALATGGFLHRIAPCLRASDVLLLRASLTPATIAVLVQCRHCGDKRGVRPVIGVDGKREVKRQPRSANGPKLVEQAGSVKSAPLSSALSMQRRDGKSEPPVASGTKSKELLTNDISGNLSQQRDDMRIPPLESNSAQPTREQTAYAKQMQDAKKARKPKEVFRTLADMRRAKVAPSTIHFSIAISTAASQPRGIETAFHYFDEMINSGALPNAFTYSSLFTACAKSADTATALSRTRQLHADVKEKRIRLNVVAYTALLSAYAKHGGVDEVLAVEKEMMSAGIPRNVVTFNTLISALGKADRLADAMQRYEQMHTSGLILDMFTYSSLFDACARSSDADQARSRVRELRAALKEKSIELSVVGYNALMNFYATHGVLDEALGLLDEMRHSRVAPDSTTFGSCFNACANSPNRRTALTHVAQLRAEVKEKRVSLHVEGYNALIKALAKNAEVDDALGVVEEMYMAGVKPNAQTFSPILATMSRLGDVRKAWEVLTLIDKHRVELNSHIVSALFNCFAYTTEGERGLTMIRELRDRVDREGLELDVEAWYTQMKAVATCTANSRQTSAVMRNLYAIFGEMERRGCKPDEKCFRTLLYAPVFDRRNGLLEAIRAARFVAERGQPLTAHMWSNVLSVADDCGVGDPIEAEEVVGARSSVAVYESSSVPFSAWEGTVCDSLDDYIVSPRFRAPADLPPLRSCVTKPVGRFALLGGVDGILKQISLSGQKPNIELMSHFFHFAPNTSEADAFLLHRVEENGLVPRGAFVVHLVGRRCDRENRRATIADILGELSDRAVAPDLEAMYAVATQTQTRKDMGDLLAAMEKLALSPDVELFERLIDSALWRASDFAFAEVVLTEMKARRVRASAGFVRCIEAALRNARRGANRLAAEVRAFEAAFEKFKKAPL